MSVKRRKPEKHEKSVKQEYRDNGRDYYISIFLRVFIKEIYERTRYF